MGARLSTSQRFKYQQLKALILQHGHPFDKKSLKSLARWLDNKKEHIPDVFNLRDWDEIGFYIWSDQEKGVSGAASALIAWRLVLMALQGQVMKKNSSSPASSPHRYSRDCYKSSKKQNGGEKRSQAHSPFAPQNGSASEGGRWRHSSAQETKAREHYVIDKPCPRHSPDTPSSLSHTSSMTLLSDGHEDIDREGVKGSSCNNIQKNGGTLDRQKACFSRLTSHADVWKECKAQALQAGDTDFLKAFPIYFEDGPVPDWTPISYPILKDIKIAIVDYGLGAPFTIGLFESLFQAYTLIPYDIRMISKGLLTTVQNSVFENEWKVLITKYVNDKLTHKKAPPDYFKQMMYGDGPFSARENQITIQKQYLDASRDLALQALKKVADAYASAPSFTLIRQGQDEPFVDFITRLKEAIAKQVDQKDSQEILFQKLIIENANQECQHALKYLKNPTLLEMIEASTAHSGEKVRDVKKHFLAAFAHMGVPHTIKTDNGPSYVAKDTARFFSDWGITHITANPLVLQVQPPDYNEIYDFKNKKGRDEEIQKKEREKYERLRAVYAKY
ncbi:hypothetical protein BTVI_02709 [Pitangus sulphuratus]|nr:hypothetical protein BTVI_02709 [Pitangus sulphuratus]